MSQLNSPSGLPQLQFPGKKSRTGQICTPLLIIRWLALINLQAPSFVPQSLRNIQRAIHQLEPLPPVSPFPPPDYSSTFLLSHLVEKRESQLLSRPPFIPDEHIPLDAGHYHEHWYPILQAEVDYLCTQRSNIVLWNVTDLKLTDWKRCEFTLVVPGLRENYPRLDTGDLVKLRQVIASQNGFTEPFFGTGLAFEARVIASQKREGLVREYDPRWTQFPTKIQRARPLLAHASGIYTELFHWYCTLSCSNRKSYSIPTSFNLQHILPRECAPILFNGGSRRRPQRCNERWPRGQLSR